MKEIVTTASQTNFLSEGIDGLKKVGGGLALFAGENREILLLCLSITCLCGCVLLLDKRLSKVERELGIDSSGVTVSFDDIKSALKKMGMPDDKLEDISKVLDGSKDILTPH